ncbi:MAG: hypothetical protein AAF206_14750 [Bacteroidota bacterium]
MKKISLFCLCCLLGITSTLFAQEKVILDTDPGFDPDDVGCMAMLHRMASLGECEILAVVNSTNQQESPLTISAINTFYQRPAIPIGDYKNYPEKIHSPDDLYTHFIPKHYPHPLKDWRQALDAVALYREILATAREKSITILVIGTMHNFYALLQSVAGPYSALSGEELVRQKVKQVVTMGGNFIDGRGWDRTNWGGAEALCSYTEWSCINEERNGMCRYVIDNCPAPFIASGWEVGCGDYHDANYGNVMSGQGLKQLPENHIVRKSYEYHFRSRGGEDRIDRHSNDQCALHFAIRGESVNYQLFGDGRISLDEKGVCQWTKTPNGQQGFIQKKRSKMAIAEEIESLMMGEVVSGPQHSVGPVQHLSTSQNRITWDAPQTMAAGTWVIGYDVYRKKKFLRRVYGQQFVAPDGLPKGRYRIQAVSANGVLGQWATVKTQR